MSARAHVFGAEGENALTAIAAETPSLVGDRPCRLLFRPERVDVWSAPAVERTPGRAAVISCGAVVFDLSLAIRAVGRMTAIHVLPLRSEPRLIAALHPGRAREPKWRERALYEAMLGPRECEPRAIDAGGFWSGAMSDLQLAVLETSAELHCLTTPQLRAVSDVLSEAGRGVGVDAFDSVNDATYDPAYARTAVLSTRGDDPAMWVRAGIAWRRVLLTATTLGLSVSCVGALLDTGDTRRRIRETLGQLACPQVVLRFGFADADAATQALHAYDTARAS